MKAIKVPKTGDARDASPNNLENETIIRIFSYRSVSSLFSTLSVNRRPLAPYAPKILEYAARFTRLFL